MDEKGKRGKEWAEKSGTGQTKLSREWIISIWVRSDEQSYFIEWEGIN